MQEYVPTSPANLVRSLMYLIDMLMHESINKDDAADNKHIKVYLVVSERNFGTNWICTQVIYENYTSIEC